jgi:hypothetical protein
MANTQQHSTISSNLTDANTFYMVRDYLERIAELKQVIQISVTESPKKNVLEKIAKKADLGIAYNADLESLKQPVTIERKHITVGDALMLVLKDTGFEPTISRTREIVLTRVEVEKPTRVEVATGDEMQDTVQGRVIDGDTGETMPGVNVTIQGTTTGTTTDINGNYQLVLPFDNAVLVFSFIGYSTQEVPVEDQTQINVELRRGIDHSMNWWWSVMVNSSAVTSPDRFRRFRGAILYRNRFIRWTTSCRAGRQVLMLLLTDINRDKHQRFESGVSVHWLQATIRSSSWTGFRSTAD